jgi:hypothetical protein
MNDEQHKRLGRPPGSPNKFTADLRNAMAKGALLSDDAKDPDNEDAQPSLEIYMKNIANKHSVAFFKALTRLIPQVQEIHKQSLSEASVEISYAFHSVADVKAALLDAGLSREQVHQLESMMPDASYQQLKPDTDEEDHDE